MVVTEQLRAPVPGARSGATGQPQGGARPAKVATVEAMLFRDPPDHTRLRSLVSAAFTPRQADRMRADWPALRMSMSRLLQLVELSLSAPALAAADDAATKLDAYFAEDELVQTLTFMFMAGVDTMTNLLASGIAALLAHPGQPELPRGSDQHVAGTVLGAGNPCCSWLASRSARAPSSAASATCRWRRGEPDASARPIGRTGQRTCRSRPPSA